MRTKFGTFGSTGETTIDGDLVPVSGVGGDAKACDERLDRTGRVYGVTSRRAKRGARSASVKLSDDIFF